MSKIMRIAVLAMSLVSLFAVLSATASATTWTNTEAQTFTATGAGGTLSSTGSPLGCSSEHASGTAPADSTGTVATGTIIFTGCRLAASSTPIHCNYALTALAFTAPDRVLGNADLTCGVFLGGREFCHIEGSTPVDYTNGSTSPLRAGTFTFTHSTTLTITNGNGGGSCLLGNGDRATLTHFTLFTSGAGPIIHP